MIDIHALAEHLGCVEDVVHWGMYDEWYSFRVRGAQTGVDIWFHLLTFETLGLSPDLFVGITPPSLARGVKNNAILKFGDIQSKAKLDDVDWNRLEVLCLERLLMVQD